MKRRNTNLRRPLPILLAVIAASLTWASTASAISVDSFDVRPASTDAGANSALEIDFSLSGGAPKDLVIHLPPGLVGNPLATPTCTEEQLNADACPAASDVGDIENDVQILGFLPQTAGGQIYNVKPRPGEPARFGFVLNAPPADKIVLQSPASLRPSDFGLDTVLNDLPQNATVAGIPLPITINAVRLDLAGQVGDPPQGFLRNPTSCGVNTFSVDVTPYSGAPGSASDSFETVNCAALPFSPEFSAALEQSGATTDGVEVSTTIAQTIEEAGLKRATVTLPPELTADGVVITNTCPDEQFQAGTCPESAAVGEAVAASPLQSEPLVGKVYLVPSLTGNFLPDLGVDLRGPLALKLKGNLGLLTGTALRAQVTFDNLPDIPISEFTLTFNGGPDGLNDAAPGLCRAKPAFDASFLAHSGATVDLTRQARCSSGPEVKAKLRTPKSGEPILKLKAKRGIESLRLVKVKLPKGVSFARGKKFKKGTEITADGKRIKATGKKRSIKIKLKGDGAKKVKARFAEGAVRASKNAGAAYKFDLRDVGGDRHKLTAG